MTTDIRYIYIAEIKSYYEPWSVKFSEHFWEEKKNSTHKIKYKLKISKS